MTSSHPPEITDEVEPVAATAAMAPRRVSVSD